MSAATDTQTVKFPMTRVVINLITYSYEINIYVAQLILINTWIDQTHKMCLILVEWASSVAVLGKGT